jgi:hypothetical protein
MADAAVYHELLSPSSFRMVGQYLSILSSCRKGLSLRKEHPAQHHHNKSCFFKTGSNFNGDISVCSPPRLFPTWLLSIFVPFPVKKFWVDVKEGFLSSMFYSHLFCLVLIGPSWACNRTSVSGNIYTTSNTLSNKYQAICIKYIITILLTICPTEASQLNNQSYARQMSSYVFLCPVQTPS